MRFFNMITAAKRIMIINVNIFFDIAYSPAITSYIELERFAPCVNCKIFETYLPEYTHLLIIYNIWRCQPLHNKFLFGPRRDI